jgi:hypothetical protein
MTLIAKRLRKVMVIVLIAGVLTMPSAGIGALAESGYIMPEGIETGAQGEVQSKIDIGTAHILEIISADMTAAVVPLIPQMTALAVAKNKEIAPQIESLSITDMQPSLKIHVEEQARIVAQEIMSIVSSAMMSAGPQSDPSSAISAAITAAIPRIQKDAIDRANIEQTKNMLTVQPKIEAIAQGVMKEVIPETQAIVLAKLKETVPVTQKAVDNEINKMIEDAASGLSEDQKALLIQMRPQFEAKLRPQIAESLFDAVSIEIDQQVLAAMKGEIIASIRDTVATMNQYCTDFAVNYSKSLLPAQVDQLGIRQEVEKMIDDSASSQLPIFENRIMAANEAVWTKQSTAINEEMHSFIKTQVLAILSGGSVQGVIPIAPVTSANLVNVELNGNPLNFDVPPVMELGRVLVPLRVIFEALGAEVSWDQATQTISATKSGVTIRLQPGQKQASQNGAQITMDVPAKIINGRTMVPVRFVSEALGADVSWDNNTRTVSIQ